MAIIKKPKGELKEGYFFLKWMENRFRRNKNVLSVETGGTGSGKSFRDLRKAELWYKHFFNKPFPVENICFSITEMMNKLKPKEVEKGEVFILEEAGANLGSLDFQKQVSKLFTYVLQSFRSLNVAIFFNLPYLSMLNKQARMLLHCSGESIRVDKEKGKNYCKIKFHQVNQDSGKIYKKHLRVNWNGRKRPIKVWAWSMPSKRLVDAYETKKFRFLQDITQEFRDKLKKIEEKNADKMKRPNLTSKQKEVYDLVFKGYKQEEIAEKLGVTSSSISSRVINMRKKGYKMPEHLEKRWSKEKTMKEYGRK